MKPLHCGICLKEIFDAKNPLRVVRCLGCSRKMKACDSCFSVFTGCTEKCRKRHRERMGADFSENSGYDYAPKRFGARRKPKGADEYQGTLF